MLRPPLASRLALPCSTGQPPTYSQLVPKQNASFKLSMSCFFYSFDVGHKLRYRWVVISIQIIGLFHFISAPLSPPPPLTPIEQFPVNPPRKKWNYINPLSKGNPGRYMGKTLRKPSLKKLG